MNSPKMTRELQRLVIEELRQRELLAAKLKASDSYIDYCVYSHEGAFKRTKLAQFICSEVQQFVLSESGNPYDILILTVPPQHGKSKTVTETLPSWYLGKRPYHNVIEISYNDDFAQKFGRRNREKLKIYGKQLFNVQLADVPNSVTEFEIKGTQGGMVSAGIGGSITGRPCNLMIIDDPIKNQADADSETKREKIWDEWHSTFKSRLAAGAKVIVILTRWHEDDLAGKLLTNEKNIRLIKIPLEAEEKDPLGREIGKALCPELGKNDTWLREFKESYKAGARAWNSLYQCSPSSAEGNLIKRDWWKKYKTLPKCAQTILSVDATFKEKKDNDFVALQVWGKCGVNAYLIDAFKRRMGFLDTLNSIRDFKRRFPAIQLVLIEDKANGSAVIEVLKREISGILPVEPKGGKIARVNAISGYIESGNVYVPEYGAFADDFIEECAAFPNGVHDDQVDCMSQALNKLFFYTGLESSVTDDIGEYDDFLNMGV